MQKKQLSLFEQVVTKFEQSSATVTELRIPFFAPITKIAPNSTTAREFKKNGGIRHLKTAWGEASIRGRNILTQVHRDVLDCVYANATDIRDLDTDEILVLFNAQTVMRAYAGEKGSKNAKWLKKIMLEIRDTSVELKKKDEILPDFNIIRSFIDASDQYGSYGIILDKRYLQFFQSELTINYKKILSDILSIHSATIKAIVRWFLTHKKAVTFKLVTVLDAIGYPSEVSIRTQQMLKKELRENIDTMKKFGVDYDPKEESFYYRGNENVGFIPSLFAKDKKRVERDKTPKKSITRPLPVKGIEGMQCYDKGRDMMMLIDSVDIDKKRAVITYNGGTGKATLENSESLSLHDFSEYVYNTFKQLEKNPG